MIVGPDRSGTTLLAVMVGRHPAVAVPPETIYFRYHLQAVERMLAEGCDADEVIDYVLTGKVGTDLKLSRQEIKQHLAGELTGAGLFAAVMDAWAARAGKPRWCEKSPLHLFHANRILRRIPDMRFIAMMRDGRDVARSRAKEDWAPGGLLKSALHWARAAQRTDEHLRRHPNRFLLVKFEQLLQDPQHELQRICEYIGEDYDPKMLDSDVGTEAIPEREEGWKSKARGMPDPSRIGAWQKSADPESVYVMNSIQKPMLRKFGYGNTEIPNECSPQVRREVRTAVRRLRYERIRRRGVLLLGRLIYRDFS